MIGRIAAVVSSLMIGAFCCSGHAVEPGIDLSRKLQQELDRAAHSAGGVSILAGVSVPSIGLEWDGATGGTVRGKAEPRLRPNDSFRIASVTKVYVAAAVFRLIEERRVGLYDSIDRYIGPETSKILESGGYDPRAIRVQQLLAHTSGLYDYAMDADFAAEISRNPAKHWTRREQIEWAVHHGKPIGPPGKQYHYSDTGYVILGEILERVSGQAMPAYVRSALSFETAKLGSTYFESLEKTPSGLPARVHQYWLETDITDFDPSMDLYGGGGLVSTTHELNVFMRSLLTGKLFMRPDTLAAALTPVAVEAGMGIHPSANMIATVPFGGRICWGHLGYWGTVSLYCPDIDAAVSMTVNASIDDRTRKPIAVQQDLMARFSKVIEEPLRQTMQGRPGAAPARN